MLPGEPGIRKRINKLGGLTIFKQYFQNYIKNIQEKNMLSQIWIHLLGLKSHQQGLKTKYLKKQI